MAIKYNDYVEHSLTINAIKFTPRETDIVACMVCGRSNKIISIILETSPYTIISHIRNIMLKLGCHSKEGVIDFVEKSGSFALFRNHYCDLLVFKAFRKALSAILILTNGRIFYCSIVYSSNMEVYESLFAHIKACLSIIEVKLNLEKVTSEDYLRYYELSLAQANESIIFSISQMPFLSLDKNSELSDVSYLQLRPLQNEQFVRFVVDNTTIDLETKHVDDNKHLLLLHILEKVLHNFSLNKIIDDFKQSYEFIYKSSEHAGITSNAEVNDDDRYQYKIFDFIRYNKIKCFIGVLVLVISTYLYVTLIAPKKELSDFAFNEKNHTFTIRSDLLLPSAKVLITRSDLIKVIDNSWKNTNDIETIALVGIGGAGKTILARDYAKLKNFSIIWELHAETQEALDTSFENFAVALSQTEEDKKILREIQDLKNFQEKIAAIKNFIKQKLKLYPNWLLIYDNVEDFNNIQKDFPYDTRLWGKGKVIVTTRNNNIKNYSNINNVVFITEFTSHEKFLLFNNIIKEEKQLLSADQEKLIREFLVNIPPFPLDISIAAYYIKTTNISYDKYIEYLKESTNDFNSLQESVLKEVSEYSKVRYNIIVLSIKHLLQTNQQFGELLFFTSLLNSKNIPEELLTSYKGSAIADNFIYNLQKYSLITSRYTDESRAIPIISLHPSTQDVVLSYFLKVLDKKNFFIFLNLFAQTLQNHLDDAINKEDVTKIKIIQTNCETFLNHKFVSPNIKDCINAKLGCAYYYLGDYEKARSTLEKNLVNLNSHADKNNSIIAQVLVHLGIVYRSIIDYKKAKNFLEKGLETYKRYIPND